MVFLCFSLLVLAFPCFSLVILSCLSFRIFSHVFLIFPSFFSRSFNIVFVTFTLLRAGLRMHLRWNCFYMLCLPISFKILDICTPGSMNSLFTASFWQNRFLFSGVNTTTTFSIQIPKFQDTTRGGGRDYLLFLFGVEKLHGSTFRDGHDYWKVW